jgi:polyisoprenyl-teichoic acid--peptidoglycan teichoic acid transferase
VEQPRSSFPFGSRRDRVADGSRWRYLLRALLLIGVGVLVGGISYVITSVSVVLSEIYEPLPAEPAQTVRATPVTEGERVNVLVLGLDDDKIRSDTMILVSIDVENRKVGVVQLPRDTRARLAGKGTLEKLNAAYAYGVRDREFPAPLRAMKTVEDLLGVHVHYHVSIDMEGFKRIIDSVGGVWVDIPFPMEYDDPYQNLSIRFSPGRQKLNGEQALKYVRWRKNNDGTGYPDGDLGRIRAQQEFMKTVLEELFRPTNLPFLMNQAVTVSRYVESTLEPARVVNLARFAMSLKKEDVEFTTLPGVDVWLPDTAEGQRLSYFLPDPEKTQELLDRLVRGIDRSYNATVRVQVLAGDNRLRAEELSRALAEMGYDVRPPDKPGSDIASPAIRVVSHGTDQRKAQVVGRSLVALGRRVELVNLPDAEARVDVTVMLGREP